MAPFLLPISYCPRWNQTAPTKDLFAAQQQPLGCPGDDANGHFILGRVLTAPTGQRDRHCSHRGLFDQVGNGVLEKQQEGLILYFISSRHIFSLNRLATYPTFLNRHVVFDGHFPFSADWLLAMSFSTEILLDISFSADLLDNFLFGNRPSRHFLLGRHILGGHFLLDKLCSQHFLLGRLCSQNFHLGRRSLHFLASTSVSFSHRTLVFFLINARFPFSHHTSLLLAPILISYINTSPSHINTGFLSCCNKGPVIKGSRSTKN